MGIIGACGTCGAPPAGIAPTGRTATGRIWTFGCGAGAGMFMNTPGCPANIGDVMDGACGADFVPGRCRRTVVRDGQELDVGPGA